MFDHVVDTIPTMSIGAPFDHVVASQDAIVGPVYSMPVAAVRTRAVSPNYAYIVREVRARAISPNFQYQVGELFFGLIRNKQIIPDTVALDKLSNIPIVSLASFNSVDLTLARLPIPLYTVPSGKTAVILGIGLEATQATNVTVVPQISVGIAAGETDIFDVEALVDFDETQDMWLNWLVLSKGRAATSGQVVKLNLQTPATATTLTAGIHLMGFLV
jgi:hypothetical protein